MLCQPTATQKSRDDAPVAYKQIFCNLVVICCKDTARIYIVRMAEWADSKLGKFPQYEEKSFFVDFIR